MNEYKYHFLILLPLIILFSSGQMACTVSQAFRSPSTYSQSSTSLYATAMLDSSSYIQLQTPPEEMETTDATVFLETIERVQRPDTAFLVIKGNFSNGCSHLKRVTHTINDNTLLINFDAWQLKNRLCTQVLTPFKYLYPRLTTKQVRSLRYYMKRGTKKPF